MKNTVLNVLKNYIGSDNVRVETSKVYIFVKDQNAFVFFTTRIALESYKYDMKSGWQELQIDIVDFGY